MSTSQPGASEEGPLSYAAYLDAKKSVDDRSLNQHVVTVLRRELAAQPVATVLEIGAGVGTMLARLSDWGVLNRADYTLLDVDQSSIDAAPGWLTAWAEATGRRTSHAPDGLRIEGGDPLVDITVHFVCADLTDYLGSHRSADPMTLLIANAFLDLVEVPATLPVLFERLAPSGLYWFSINFDGETVFLPEHPADVRLIDVYHRSMDQRVRLGRPAGDSHAGRHLFQHLRAAGARILAAGSSDWVVHAIDGTYPAKEGEFIEHILHTIDAELKSRAEIDQELLQDWLRTRRDQLERGELVYVTHQLDFVGRRSA
jgi:SAM-dependent methyltransferase